jgi:hypothetical protein
LGGTSNGDVVSRCSRFRKFGRTASVIICARCNLHCIAGRRNVEGIIGRSARAGLGAGVGIAARRRDVVSVALADALMMTADVADAVRP